MDTQVEETLPVTAVSAGGLWLWFLQRLTGVALILILGLHIWVGHFANIEAVKVGSLAELVVFENVSQRLQLLGFIILDFSLLGLALWHGLNGVRTVILDFGIGQKTQRALSITLLIIGVVAFVYGANALLPFITGQSFF